MADDTKKFGMTEQDGSGNPDTLVAGVSDSDYHFGNLDVDDVYVLPSFDPDHPSALESEFMFGAEGQELTEGTLVPASNEAVTAEVGAFMTDLSEDYDLDMPFDISSSTVPVLTSVPETAANLFELPLDTAKSLVDLDQLFDAVGAKSTSGPFGEAPDHHVSLEDTFWDKAAEEQPVSDQPELFEPLVAVDPGRALDNIFETLYVADES